MSRLIVLSNRVKMPDDAQAAGGLAVALDDILVGSSVIWMGWNGEVVETFADNSNQFNSRKHSFFSQTNTQTDTRSYKQQAHKDVTYMTTAFTRRQYQHFYCGFANSVLWFMLHERPELVSEAMDDYAGYQAVNCLFARQLSQIIEPDDVIWVHDYHFLSVAYYCRKLGINNRIGFFLHIPFAPLAFWKKIDKSAELITHLAHYDVIGTQTVQDKINCIDVLSYYLSNDLNTQTIYSLLNDVESIKSDKTHVQVDLGYPTSHHLTIHTYPIGINVDKIQTQVSHLSSKNLTHRPKDSTTQSVAQQIIAVDRIDYSKGLLQRFWAYHKFLKTYPAYQHQLELLQIACPSRLDLPVYQQLYTQVKQVVDDINQQFATSSCHTYHSQNASHTCTLQHNWQAVHYSEKVLDHETLMQAFWHSDVGWVNSLKDGMNLVAKEYIAAQNLDDPGVLLLSKYAGAAEHMQAAVIIDPHQPVSIIEGLKTALTMPLSERKERHQTLLAGLRNYDINAWQQDFLADLYTIKSDQAKNTLPRTTHKFDLQE